MQNNRHLWAGVLLVGALVGVTYRAAQDTHDTDSSEDNQAVSEMTAAEPREQRYTCPMHPHIVQDHPGSCPICGMDLVAVEQRVSPGVTVDAAMQQTLGVRLAEAKPRFIARDIRTYGKVAIDQGKTTYITPKFDGWIRRIHVKSAGDRVNAGDVLYELYSPDLIARQGDYLKLQERRRQLLSMMPNASSQESEIVMDLLKERTRVRTRMVYEDIDPETLRDLEDLNQPLLIVPFRAPKDGVVTEIGAREGSFVKLEDKVLTLIGLDEVWVDVVLFEDQLAMVREGDELTVTFPAVGGTTAEGTLTWASPLLDATTRTARARLSIPNEDERLRPGMYAEVTIKTKKEKKLAVPRSAIMRNGDGEFVMRHDGDGHFLPVPVHVGIETGNWIEIRHGLNEGDHVAVNGQFLLTAEASLADARERMAAGRQHTTAAEDSETPP